MDKKFINMEGRKMTEQDIFIAESSMTRKLKMYLKNNRNILFIGKHGTGKSTIVKNLWEAEGLNYRIFSAATMDPWVDFIGCPRPKVDEDTGEEYLDLVRPREFQNDEVEALFFDEFNRCLTGDTKISLADGSVKCIKDLVGISYFYVYSYDIKNKKIEIGKAHSARVTRKDQKILKITLDNGLSVRCTVDHPFLTRSGKYKNAEDLVIGDSLMPLYRKKSNRIKKNKYIVNGYEEVYHPELDTYEYTHVLLDRCNLRHSIYGESKGSFDEFRFIVSIEFDGHEDVYDITVDEFHNFALEAGVFVHNSHKKIRNAVMELIQFKSINGRHFENLRVVWAAINPENDEVQEYDVEAIDPAQKDRFHIHIYMPYKPNKTYFKFKFGDEISEAACSWWDTLQKETIKNPEIINRVSPRRLDYALEIHLENGLLDDVLPKESNPSKLRELLTQIPTISKLNDFMASKDRNAAKEFLDNENNLAHVTAEIIRRPGMIDFFIPLLPPERRNALISKETIVSTWALRDYQKYPEIRESLKQIKEAGTNRVLTSQITKKFEKDRVRKAGNMADNPKIDKEAKMHYVIEKRGDKEFSNALKNINKKEILNTYHRSNVYNDISDKIPHIMTETDAKKCLGVFDLIIKWSHRKMLLRWDKISGIINTCVKNLSIHGKYKFSSFKNDFPSILEYAINSDEHFYFILETDEESEDGKDRNK